MICKYCQATINYTGKGRKPRYCSEVCKQKAKRVRSEEKRVKKLLEERSKLYLVPCDLDMANAFVALFHRHNKPVTGAKFCLAVVDEQNKLRGVAIVGRPVARLLQDGFTLEVNRVASDGCPNACSILYAAARKVTFDLGYVKLITYTLQSESGSSMRGAGWKITKETKGNNGWGNRPNRQEQEVSKEDKWRWETINPNKRKPIKIILPDAMTPIPPSHEQLDMFETA